MSKIILFNSPKNVGKSKAIEYLKSEGINLISAECKEALHNLTMTLFGVSPERYWEIYNTRELKEVPLDEFSMNLPFGELTWLEDCVGYIPDAQINFTRRGTSVKLSIRQAMIYVSEIVVKPRWEQDWFGQERVRKIKMFEESLDEYLKLLFCDDSCAFVEELVPLIEYLGQENILLIRIHRDGFTFDGDSRSYIPNGVIANTVNINNDGTEIQFLEEVEHVVRKWLNE